MIKYFCDRCKEECTNDVEQNKTLQVQDVSTLYNRVVFNADSTLMLCKKCALDYHDFLKGYKL